MRYWDSEDSGTRRARRKRAARVVASGGSIRKAPFLRRFYRHQAEISEGIQKFIFFVIMAALVYVFFLSDSGLIRIVSLERQRAQLEESIEETRVLAQEMADEIEHLKKDPFYMEKLGRRYGYIYPGERVYKIVPLPDRIPARDK